VGRNASFGAKNSRVYLQNIGAGGVRYNLDGTESGVIVQLEREHAGRILAAKQKV
jgi:sRNA-binding protein